MKIRSLPTTTSPTANKYAVSSLINTRFGQFIRRTHLDELPQFWLVVWGEMSLIGPRPEFPELSSTFDKEFVAERLAVRPGISGLWQVSSASSGLIGEAPEFDRLYLAKASLRIDAWVMVRTIGGMSGAPALALEQFPRWIVGLNDASAVSKLGTDSRSLFDGNATDEEVANLSREPISTPASDRRVSAFTCCAVRIDAQTLGSAVDVLMTPPNPPIGRSVHLCNAYTLSLARRNPTLARRLNAADLNLPDGMPLIWIARWLGLEHLTGRVYGPDLMLTTMDQGRATGMGHFLYGSTSEVLERLETELNRRFPGLRIVGRESPPFRNASVDEEAALLQDLSKLKPDIVWVALGTPKQDAFVDELSQRSSATFVAVGAAFDFISGAKRQAPVWMQDRGLEWIFRLVHEPRRLANRYLVHNFLFVTAVLRDRPRVVVS
jgi:N-acetylglucosaminyldiphosphoundecaprenol N-acetyl-beta-D-mannosaminyltransferase